jgi:formate/nitrite transporter FocA (FNT family)
MKKKLNTFIYAVLAGFTIGIGGNVYLALLGTSKPLGAVLFTVGLFTICTFGLNLFTGKVCYALDNKPSYIIDLVVIWAGNLIGAWLMAALAGLTRLGASFSDAALSLCETKMNDSLLSLFCLGIMCNLLIYIAVEGFKNNPHELGKYLSLIFGVTVFILTGTEHSVADMYYFAAAGLLFTGKGLLCVVVITLGNAVGGLIFPICKKVKSLLDK